MAFPFNVAEYVHPPKMDVARAIAMVAKLLRDTPADAPASVRAAAERLRKRAATLRVAWVQRAEKPATTTTKPQVVALAGAWAAVQSRLAAWTRLPADELPESAEAQALLDVVLSDGLRFLKMEHEPLWAESGRRLELIDKAPRAERVAALAGEPFVQVLRRAHRACGDALGFTARLESADEVVDLSPLLNAVREAVGAYALQLVAATDADDAAAVASTARALAPIDHARGRAKSRRAVTSGADDEDLDPAEGDAKPETDDVIVGGRKPAPDAEPAPDAVRNVERDASPANDNPAPDVRAPAKRRRVA